MAVRRDAGPEGPISARRDAWEAATVDAVRDGLPDHHRVLVPVDAGLGLAGEASGLGVDPIDLLCR